MMRRFWLAVVVVVTALGAPPGCGMAIRKIQGEPNFPVGTARRTFDSPTQRVAFATLEAMRAELASADFAPGQDNAFRPVDGAKPDAPTPGDAAFWLSWTAGPSGPAARQRVILLASHFEGTTRDGRAVRVEVLFRDRGERSLVSIHLDPPGDPGPGRALLDKIADRLAHPTYPPHSPEEAETLQAFFGGAETREALPSLRKIAGR